jgi:replicative superfamily II helicase
VLSLQDHFEKASIPGEAKVIFFTPTTVLVEQQCKQVKKYLPHLTSIAIKGGNEVKFVEFVRRF